jgi:hypothetical protein
MAKNKWKPAAAVKRTQDPLHAHVPSHTNQGGSLVLGLKSALGTLSGSISHIPNIDLPPPPTVISFSDAGTSTVREADGSPVANNYASLDGFLVKDYYDEEDLEEEQLDFTFSKEEYEKSSPSSPAPATPEIPTSPKGASLDPFNTVKTSKSHSSPPTSGRWRDLFSYNRSISICRKLMHFSNFNAIKSCPFLAKDLDHSCDD